MIIIDDKIISDDVVEKHFVCNLSKCKGACCWEGDFGAPLNEEEMDMLDKYIDVIKPHLSEESQAALAKEGKYTYYDEPKEHGTPLLSNGACAYLSVDKETNISFCSIERLHKEGAIPFNKPISCHLYPIRVTHNETFDAINYDKWDICSDACSLGEELKIPVYQFAKEALILKYGEDFYEELDAAAQYHRKSND